MIYIQPGFVGDVYNLEHPRVLWNSVARRATVPPGGGQAGFDRENVLTATTFDKWKPASMGANVDMTFASTETISAVAIAAHTIGSTGTSVRIEEWNGSTYVQIMPRVYPSDDSPIAFLFSSRDRDRLRVNFGGTVPPEVGVIHVCEALELPQRVYMGAPTPIDMARQTEFRTTQSANGQYLGRSVLRQQNTNEFTVEHLSEGWVRSTLDPFIQDALEYPYFLLERPYSCPTALSYRWRDSDIITQRMGIRDLMQVSL